MRAKAEARERVLKEFERGQLGLGGSVPGGLASTSGAKEESSSSSEGVSTLPRSYYPNAEHNPKLEGRSANMTCHSPQLTSINSLRRLRRQL